MLSPFTPGIDGDTQAAAQLADMGIIFIMFGVGLHFSLRDLWSARTIVLPGALLQITLTTVAGTAVGLLWGWPLGSAVILGLSISVASTVVLLRNLGDNGLVNTIHGRTAIGWLVVEDCSPSPCSSSCRCW